jgi:hypothetical protein
VTKVNDRVYRIIRIYFWLSSFPDGRKKTQFASGEKNSSHCLLMVVSYLFSMFNLLTDSSFPQRVMPFFAFIPARFA